MNELKKRKIPYNFIMMPTLFSLMVYVFFYQYAYPFTATVFLYVAFAGLVLYLFLLQKIRITPQLMLLLMVVAISWLGVLYTDNLQEGVREAILLSVMVVLLLAASQYGVVLLKARRIIYTLSFVVLAGIYLQYTFPDLFNTMMQPILRTSLYEQLMWSYQVDGAYAGFSANTPDAAYFSALIFGFALIDFLKNKKKTTRKQKILNIILCCLALLAVILTSKRGLAVALILAFVLTYLIWKKMSSNAIVGLVFLCIVGFIALNVLSQSNPVVGAFMQRFEVVEGGDITTGRTAIWGNAFNGFDNWILGNGTGATYTVADGGMHNIYLQILYDHGLIGLVIYVSYFVFNFRNAIKRSDIKSLYIQLLLLIYGMTGNPIYSTSFFIVYIIFTTVDTDSVLGEELKNEFENVYA